MVGKKEKKIEGGWWLDANKIRKLANIKELFKDYKKTIRKRKVSIKRFAELLGLPYEIVRKRLKKK